jgi:hypothetical protein
MPFALCPFYCEAGGFRREGGVETAGVTQRTVSINRLFRGNPTTRQGVGGGGHVAWDNLPISQVNTVIKIKIHWRLISHMTRF